MNVNISVKHKLNDKNFLQFQSDVFNNLRWSTNLVSYLESDSREFEFSSKKILKDIQERRAKVIEDGMKLDRERLEAEKHLSEYKGKYQVTSQGIQEVRKIISAKDYRGPTEEQLKEVLPLNKKREWEETSSSMMEVVEDQLKSPGGKRMTSHYFLSILDIYKEEENMRSINTKAAILAAMKEDLADERAATTTLMRKEEAILKKDGNILINLLLLDSEQGLIDADYLRVLRNNSVIDRNLKECQKDSDVKKLWDYLKSLQRTATRNRMFDQFIQLISMKPLPDESLTKFDQRFDLLWNGCKADMRAHKGYVDGGFPAMRIDPSVAPPIFNVSCVSDALTIYLSRIVTDAYRNIIKDYYGSAAVQKFLEPFYQYQDSVGFRETPITVDAFREQLQHAVHASSEISDTQGESYYSLSARVKVPAPIAPVINAVVTKTNSCACSVCGKTNHMTHECFSIPEEDRATMARIIDEAKSRRGAGNKNKKKKPVIKSSSENKKSNQVQLSSMLFKDRDDEDEEDEYLCTVTDVQPKQEMVLLDNGASCSVFNDQRLFEGIPARTTNEVRGISNNGILMRYKGTTVFGAAYYSTRSINVISQSSVEKCGFRITPHYKNKRTVGYWMTKKRLSIYFKLTNGVYVGDIEKLLKLIEDLKRKDSNHAKDTTPNKDICNGSKSVNFHMKPENDKVAPTKRLVDNAKHVENNRIDTKKNATASRVQPTDSEKNVLSNLTNRAYGKTKQIQRDKHVSKRMSNGSKDDANYSKRISNDAKLYVSSANKWLIDDNYNNNDNIGENNIDNNMRKFISTKSTIHQRSSQISKMQRKT